MIQRTNMEPPTLNQMLEALQSRRRRQLLVNLAERNPRNEATQMEELAVQGDEEQFFISLQHVHLPKLEQMDLIEWDRQSGEIVRGPQFGEIQPLIKMMIRQADELPSDLL